VVVVIVSSAGWYLDGRRRMQEFTALAQCVATAEDSWRDADARVTAMASYVAPSAASSRSRSVQRGLYRLVAREAARGEPFVQQALERCRAVPVLPFHPALRAARAAYVACLQAEVDRLAATRSDGSRAFSNSDRLSRLRDRAFAELSAAAPDERARRVTERLLDRR
jgi:hypothetical protein